MKRVDVAYTLLYDEQENSVLLVLNRKNNTWTLPGGGVEKGETLRDAAIRETKEETGYDVTVGDIVAVNEAFLGEHHAIFFTFEGKITTRPEKIPKEKNILSVEWVSLAEADNRLEAYHPEGLSQLLKNGRATYRLED